MSYNMSHTVTVTRTTTTSTSAVILNTGYFKTWPGILKFFELILGIAAVAIVGYYYNTYYQLKVPETFFLLIFTTFMIGTFLILFSCLISLSTASILSKTVYESVYHGFACLLCLIAGLVLLIEVNHYKRSYGNMYESYFAASVIGLVLAALYLISSIFAIRGYRGL
ncbi:uncharacterized protein LOC108745197 [Agrilus planipennis]|uniref:Uncharacterized protein LOC108745197 n=1 Tax=Agrilus planipennis TaxID=224129 RepID=A0A7F5RN05_AGRPL|nr:uncharacterized protein LOC108745197 [Agrilus planipennis]XP_025837311.1 uncharacterized protein LOC108745197 [Agrilus planipennis]